jgi:hypothetical protein
LPVDKAEGGKIFLPLSLWRHHSGKMEWRWKGIPAPRPLYGLDKLAARAVAPVIVTEGEKSADAAARAFPDYVTTTSPVGCKAEAKADWTPLAGRTVTIWPDADEPGTKYAASVARILHGLGCRVSVIGAMALANLPPSKFKEGWDAANAAAEWQDIAALRKAAHGLAKPFKPRARSPDGLDKAAGLPDDPLAEGVSLDDFNAYMPMHSYIFTPSREMWPAGSVNARIFPVPLLDKKGKPMLDKAGKQKTMSANAWLDRNKPVEQMTWAPGEPMLIQNRLISDGGWIERKGATCFNHYRPPVIALGNAAEAGPWLEHVRNVFPDDHGHIIKWLAHRVQRPQEKINHALVLGGNQGVGKDTLLEPVKRAIGPWNFSEVSPLQMLGRFNGFLKSVILRVSEARDLGDVDRFQFYDHMKSFTAAPPDVLRVDEKHLREYYVFNCCGVIITSNHKTDGIYLPPDDRRHFVAWSDLVKEGFAPAYWNGLWRWYERGGYDHVAAYLAGLDIEDFDPKAPPPKTPAFCDIVDANRAPEDAELADVLDEMGNPDVTTLSQLVSAATGKEIETWLRDRKNRRVIRHRLEKCGYVQVRNDTAKDGLWKVNGTRQVIYGKSALPARDRLKAAGNLMQGGR